MVTSQISAVVFLFLTLTPLLFSEGCHPDDKKALLRIKKDLKNPYEFDNWKENVDCCEWNVVECDQKTNRIIRFEIRISNLKLPIPAAIGDLPYLQILIFNFANVTGQIPQAISKLSHLKSLILRLNLLTGPVPAFLSHLKKLTYLELSYNRLTGSIPASISQLPELGDLVLDGNKLTGSIPETFADFKQKEFYLHLSHNHLSGPIPRKLGSKDFTFIDVSRNRLEGDISFLFGKNKSLQYGNFSGNRFEFDFSKVEIPQTLTQLDLNHNKICGSLPEELAKIDIISLNVSYNRLCGQIPTGGTGKLQELDYTAYFHNKCLCGSPLPKCK